MKQNFTRQCVRLLMLFVGLFALSSPGWAHEFEAGKKIFVKFDNTDWTNGGPTFKIEFNDGSNYSGKKDLTLFQDNSKNNEKIYYYEVPDDGRKYTKIGVYRYVGGQEHGYANNVAEAPDPSNKQSLLVIKGDYNNPYSDGWYKYETNIWLKFYSGSTNKYVKVENGTAKVNGSDVKGYNFGIVVSDPSSPNNQTEKFWYASTTSSNINVSKSGTSTFDLTDKSTKQNIKMDANASGDYIFTITTGRDNLPQNLTVVSDSPDLPRNIQRAGKAYLVGSNLNDNYPSPAWEFTGTGNIRNLARFAMRHSDKIGVVEYDASGYPIYYDFSSINHPGANVGGDDIREVYSQPGWEYTAQYNMSTHTLTFTPATFNVTDKTKALPYVGILGTNFRQATTDGRGYATRHKYKGSKNQDLTGNTNLGWQEAYVEYGANGYPLKDPNGEVYYNTVWPPRNNILMQSYLGSGDALNVSSNALTMKPQGTKTGVQWKTELQSNKNYTNLLPALEDGVTYVRYVVNNMWMLGDFKIWTGWGGVLKGVGDWGAMWDTHTYWGPVYQYKDNIQNKEYEERKANRPYQEIKVNTPYGTGNEAQNFYTQKVDANNPDSQSQRAYFQTMELFVPISTTTNKTFDFWNTKVDNNNKWGMSARQMNGAKLYCTAAPGGAVIDALAGGTNGDEVGYIPTLTSCPDGYYVKSYKITRHEFDPEVETTEYESLKPVTRNRAETSFNNARVAWSSKDYTYDDKIDAIKFNTDLFTPNFHDNKYVSDRIYKPGRYIFRLEVEFVNQLGETDRAIVWSPYVEIINSHVEIEPTAAQLIQLTDKTLGDYDYITYDEEYNNILVKVNNTTDNVVEKYSSVAANVTNEQINEIYEVSGKWTNKVLVRSEVPSAFYSQGIDQYVESFEVVVSNNDKREMKPFDEEYVIIMDRDIDLSNNPFYVEFNGKVLAQNANDYTSIGDTKYAPYAPHFMLPSFGSATLSFDADGNKTKEFTASHGDLSESATGSVDTQQTGITTNRHMLQADIVVNMPNIVETTNNDLRKAVFDALAFDIVKNDPDGGQSSTYAIKGEKDATSYSLSYKYQNPYDWMREAKAGETSKNNCGWVGKEHTWTIKNSNYGTSAITGIEPKLNGLVATIKAEPDFKAPVLDTEMKNLGEEAYSYTLTELEEGYQNLKLFINRMQPKLTGLKENEKDNFDKGVNMAQDEDVAFLVKVTVPEGFDQNMNINSVMTYDTAKDPSIQHPVLDYTTHYWNGYYQHINDLLNKLKIDVAYAYYFSAGGEAGSTSDDESANAKISSSDYVGLTSVNGFPKIRYDHQGDDQNKVVRRAAGDDPYTPANPTTTLTSGDNAFLLAPVYTTIKTYGNADGVPTGVEGITEDSYANVVTGNGYIEVEGSNVEIYNAAGMVIATAAGRYDVNPGVYVVRLNGKTVKVLVK